ncbi:MAG: hypothetical protein ISR77_25735 [Pirellulaceae bacterium]|nr:hypothetical protein [Pirellulaceae bacterium]
MRVIIVRFTISLATFALAFVWQSTAWSGRFEDLVARVATIETPERYTLGLDKSLAECVDETLINRRKQLMIRAGAKDPFARRRRDPRHQFPTVLCRLSLDPRDQAALAYVPVGCRFREQGDTFGKSSLARIYCQFGHLLAPEQRAAVVQEITTYPGYFSGGTENYVNMRRTAGLLFGEWLPKENFHFDITGAQMAEECRQYIRAYGKAIYRASMVEYLSPAYHVVNTNPFLNVVDHAKSEESRIMARAVLDWMMADLALNSFHGIVLPPQQREKGLLTNHYQLNHARGLAQWVGWLYWGCGTTPDDESVLVSELRPEKPYNMPALLHAVSSWNPHPAMLNIGAKRVRTPFMVWQSRGNWACIEPAHVNKWGKTKAAHAQEPNARYNMRSVYIARDYALGASYRHEDIMDPIVRNAMPFVVAWRSKHLRNWLHVAHPYWYTLRKGDDGQPLDRNDWSDTSPFLRMVHWENAAVVLYDIPTRDPYSGKSGKGSALFRSERGDDVIQCIFVYAPDTVERVERGEHFFLRDGEVFLSLRPFGGKAAWEAAPQQGFVRLAIPGAKVGFAVEVGDATEHGSFDAFQQHLAGAVLDTSHLAAATRVAYVSARGHRLDVRHTEKGWLPDARVNGVKLEFDAWPTGESPYVSCRNMVLDVNDGREGFRVDWTADLPTYSYYRIENGRKVFTRREWVEDERLRVE